MCDELTHRDAEEYLARKGLTRRDFNRQAAGATIAALLVRTADAAEIVEQEVLVETPDGEADCYFARPVDGKHPGVIVWPDIVGMRPAFRAMGKRLASSGYSVLVVNPYYRTAKGQVIPEGKTFR
ncbi:MAG: dienelactone hydrolase family protein, partial [Woeseiaceae bacterium]